MAPAPKGWSSSRSRACCSIFSRAFIFLDAVSNSTRSTKAKCLREFGNKINRTSYRSKLDRLFAIKPLNNQVVVKISVATLSKRESGCASCDNMPSVRPIALDTIVLDVVAWRWLIKRPTIETFLSGGSCVDEIGDLCNHWSCS